jgi:hypothetical protein
VAIEDDLLHVHFGPAHAQAIKEAKVLSIHRRLSESICP